MASRRVRPRYDRMAAALAALVVTTVAVLGGLDLLPGGDAPAKAVTATLVDDTLPSPSSSPVSASSPDVSRSHDRADSSRHSTGLHASSKAEDTALPADSGAHKRIVFSQSRQRVWLVNDREQVRRTYLVSGSLGNNLEPGTYQVYSKSRHAIGVADSGTMQYFVRFTQGTTGAAIGFHDIPVKDGKPLQDVSDLGTPQSRGCIRQWRPDAIALWRFAPIGTTVVVTA